MSPADDIEHTVPADPEGVRHRPPAPADEIESSYGLTSPGDGPHGCIPSATSLRELITASRP
ncbi:hypothetical protein AB0J55_03165 [Amycolatopsis sp. NPDC049688]|uniref:hypothetical protein n=1 Tax=Amycolatopsis sp. NPDC049688 TaxID=3154733 RepID=UPI003429377F